MKHHIKEYEWEHLHRFLKGVKGLHTAAELFGFELAVFEHIEDAEQHHYRPHQRRPLNLSTDYPAAFLVLNSQYLNRFLRSLYFSN